MNGTTVLDASAVLAFLQGEPGAEVVEACLAGGEPCLVSAANQAEIVAKLVDRGMGEDDLHALLAALDYRVVDVLAEDGAQAGLMRAATRDLGLSLGDRLCLAVAARLRARVITADRPWLHVDAGIDILCIRPDR